MENVALKPFNWYVTSDLNFTSTKDWFVSRIQECVSHPFVFWPEYSAIFSPPFVFNVKTSYFRSVSNLWKINVKGRLFGSVINHVHRNKLGYVERPKPGLETIPWLAFIETKHPKYNKTSWLVTLLLKQER